MIHFCLLVILFRHRRFFFLRSGIDERKLSSMCCFRHQRALYKGEAGKVVAFRRLLTEGLMPPTLVFVQSQDRAAELFRELIFDGVNIDAIHAGRTQKQREQAIHNFRSGKVRMKTSFLRQKDLWRSTNESRSLSSFGIMPLHHGHVHMFRFGFSSRRSS